MVFRLSIVDCFDGSRGEKSPSSFNFVRHPTLQLPGCQMPSDDDVKVAPDRDRGHIVGPLEALPS